MSKPTDIDPTINEDIQQIVENLGVLVNKLAGKTVVITGGSGFLGKYFLYTFKYLNESVLSEPCTVISLDNNITSDTKSFFDGKHIKQIRQDVTKHPKIEGDVDYIIHAAGIASPVYYQKYPLETIDVAVNGTRNMLELVKNKQAESFVFFSSSEIYGDPPPTEIPTKETFNGNVSCTGPRSCYDESKRLGETLSIVYFNLYQLPIKILRPFNVFGPGMGAYDHRVIPAFIYKGLTGMPIPVHSSGVQTRTFCYISDAITGFLKVLLSGKDGQAYNIGNDDNEITMNDLANLFKKVLDDKVQIANIEYPKEYPQDEPQRRCPDLTKIKNHTGYKPTVSLEDGLRRTIDWCRRNWD